MTKSSQQGVAKRWHRTSLTGGILWRPYVSLGTERTDNDDDDDDDDDFLTVECNIGHDSTAQHSTGQLSTLKQQSPSEKGVSLV